MDELLEISDQLIRSTDTTFKRYLFDQIDWNERLIGIKGARGTGKTTLVLQYLKENQSLGKKVAYFSLDELYFLSNNLVDAAKDFYQSGGNILVVDEVHKYGNWSREIKNLYDRYPNLQLIFTGSSIIDITRVEGDLSRRAVINELHGLSYREYLAFQHGMQFPTVVLDQLTSDRVSLQELFPEDFKPLQYLKDYIRNGYFPFSGTNEEMYYKKLRQLVRTIVEYDMAEIKGFDIRNGKKILQLLYIIAQQVPFKPNITALSEKTQIHRNSLSNYLLYLSEARLIDLQYPAGISISMLQKPEKILLNNTNFLFAISEKTPEKGTVRETFFNSLVKVNHRINLSTSVDFLVDDKYQFEIGGKNKSRKQIKTENTWIVKDDLEFPAGNSIPLWIFGFLY
ncbi:hypothetical protein SAMN04489724_3848 [Algoriphagus locisalis]|uniref:AAA domain-containing protein n=1 Tax=Algoriphagus locisalis TaxID=305507 RepID=A0A1I7DB55_9BACT|nr:AAA family ATPase [Algoriphagus locisalis]SFU08860.1 hypothetical protein SAMN04489724_3848 [Algoriphagus locisalis]